MKGWIRAAAAIAAMTPCVARASSEPRKTETGLPERWAQPDVVVVLDPSLDDLGPGAADAIKAAMQTWYADVVGIPRIAFEEGSARAGVAYDGKSVVSAGPIAIPGHEKDVAATTTYASDGNGDILEADVVFNTTYTFAAMPAPSSSCAGVYDIGAVATHESGHFFGLGEDYVDHTTTMYVTTLPCDAHKRVLTSGDTDSISALYKPADVLTATCDAAPAPRTPGGEGAALGFGLLALARRMRRHAHAR